MTKEQALINELQEYLDIKDTSGIDLYQEEVQMCIEALEKQIEKEIHIYANGEQHCPTCDENLTGLGFKRCIECGQKLKF